MAIQVLLTQQGKTIFSKQYESLAETDTLEIVILIDKDESTEIEKED